MSESAQGVFTSRRCRDEGEVSESARRAPFPGEMETRQPCRWIKQRKWHSSAWRWECRWSIGRALAKFIAFSSGNHKQALALALPRPQRGAWRFCSPMAPACLRLRVWTRMVQINGSDRLECRTTRRCVRQSARSFRAGSGLPDFSLLNGGKGVYRRTSTPLI